MLAATFIPITMAQQEIGFIEDFALAQDREEALAKLIPGTEDYYYFHALHYQNTTQAKKFTETLSQWKKRFNSSSRRDLIVRRQALIDYTKEPKKSLEFLRRKLGLNLSHQQEGKAKSKQYPSVLKPGEISWEKFLSDARSGSNQLSGLDQAAFFPLLASKANLNKEERRDLLARSTVPDLPGLVKLIAADLGTKVSRGFGEFQIHRELTLSQLDELARIKPELLRSEVFVHTRLSKLRPGADTKPEAEPSVRKAYLSNAWSFVKGLEPSFNSLKAHLLYQRLLFDRSQGDYDHGRFIAYLRLPRNSPNIRPEWQRENKEEWQYTADCNRDFRKITSLPPIGNDQAIVRDYLLHFLIKEDNYTTYVPWLTESWLKSVFAEAKIVNGIGDPERWTSLLSPAAFQALEKRVDIEFDPSHRNGESNAEHLGIDEPVKLRLHIKNVPKLIVKIFEVNTLNYYLDHGREVSTNLELDGLVANHERTVEFSDPPSRRIAREFEFPEIGKQRGVWVVEFIGGGKSSRSIIRKGTLDTVTDIVSAGQLITVLDESHQPVPAAGVWFGGRRFDCNKNGRALIPFSNDPGNRVAVIEDGKGFASLSRFEHSAENYALHGRAFVAREALRPGASATLLLRPNLTLVGQPISLTRLSDVRLVLTSTDLDGVTATETIPDFKLFSDREASHEFRVPDRLASLRVQLLAKIIVASHGNQQIELADATTFQANGQLRSKRVDDLYLSQMQDGYLLELLGRSGEPKAGERLEVTVVRTGFKQPRHFILKTDADGGIQLGALNGIRSIAVQTADGFRRSWTISNTQRTQPSLMTAEAGKPIRIPYSGTLDPAELALLAVSSSGITADVFDHLLLDGGFLVASNLSSGNYRLLLKDSGQTIRIEIAKGERVGDFVFNKARSLELQKRAPAQLVTVKLEGEDLAIDLAHNDKLTRVHVVATRFLPEHNLFQRIGHAPLAGLYRGRPAWLPNLYLSGRTIGDEFRYILERRYQKKFPGNMLERPEILLNPWAVQDTEAGEESLKEGEAFGHLATGSRADGEAAGGMDPFSARQSEGRASESQSIDFLKNPPITLYNLQADKDGHIRIPITTFGDRQQLHILLVDPAGASYQQLALANRETAIRDLRLANALNPDHHYTEQDSVTLLNKGESIEIPDILTARFEVFDDLGTAYRYLLALHDDPTLLREFAFVTRWANLNPAEKRDKYSEFACHELSFFLAMKDPEFFKTVVLPYLANKKDRTFLDDYLLGSDLKAYFEPYEYKCLNVPERILLARRSGERIKDIRHDLDDRLALTPPNPLRDNHLFEAALASSGMNRERNLALDEAEEALNDAPMAPPAPQSMSSAMRKSLGSGRSGKGKKMKGENLALLSSEPGKNEQSSNLSTLKESAKLYYHKDQDSDAFADGWDKDGLELSEMEADAFYRAIKKTKEWAENNYWHLPIEEHDYELITENRFWLDFARHSGKSGFGSRYLGEAARSFPEAMLALAVIDLPFDAPEHQNEIEGVTFDFTAGGRAIAFHREIKEAKLAKNAAPLLISQNWFRSDDPFRMEDGEKVDKFVSEEFIVGVVYGGRVVVTNPTGSHRKLEVLIQIPKGAIPVGGNRATRTHRISLAPYTTKRVETSFYFPAAGGFPCYPAQVSVEGMVAAHADTFEFNVVDEPSKIDASSWVHISQWGDETQVLDYLAKQNLHSIALSKIAWRCRESADFMNKALSIIDRRGIYNATLWSYGIMHNEASLVRQFLLMQGEFLDTCGLYLESELITIDPIERRAYQHLEYKPLVNNRAHSIGGVHKILNQRIRQQYQNFMRILSQKPALGNEDQLSLTYYLFLQDRAAEAMNRLKKVNPEHLRTRIQYDYFQAYASFYRSEPDNARQIASAYSDYPVERWRKRFADVTAQADEIDGKTTKVSDDESRNQVQQQRASAEPTLGLKVVGSEILVDYRNLRELRVNYHEMDLEFLFSTNPFVSSDSGGFSVVRPNKSETIQLPEGDHEHRFQLPREYQAKNVLVEIVGGGKKRAQAIYANELRTAVSENFGILTVRHAKDDRPLSKTYVKVYAMTTSGPKFYKDGYTDLRGKFDYASVSTSDIADASKFSILVMSEKDGATVLEAPVPTR